MASAGPGASTTGDQLAGFVPPATALLVVDMQHAFASPGGVTSRMGADLSTSRAIIPTVSSLLHAARRAGVPVVFLRVIDAPGGASIDSPERARRQRIGLPLHAIPEESWDAEIIPEVTPRAGDITVTKRRLCGFVGTDLDLILRSREITHIVVSGLQSHACVLSTAWIGSMLGYWVAVPSDGTASPREELHRAAMALLHHSIHAVPRTAEIVALWESVHAHHARGGSVPG
jgi:nicotinamidase-related amidase